MQTIDRRHLVRQGAIGGLGLAAAAVFQRSASAAPPPLPVPVTATLESVDSPALRFIAEEDMKTKYLAEWGRSLWIAPEERWGWLDYASASITSYWDRESEEWVSAPKANESPNQ